MKQYNSKREAIRALIKLYGDDKAAWPQIIYGFALLMQLGLIPKRYVDDPHEIAKAMLWHRERGQHGWPEARGGNHESLPAE